MLFAWAFSSASWAFRAQISVGGTQPTKRGADTALSQPRMPEMERVLFYILTIMF